MLGGGVRTAKIEKKMREKHFISRSQFHKMESLLAVVILTKDWVPVTTHNEKGEFLPDYRPKTPDDIVVEGEDDERRIAMTIAGLRKDGYDEVFAAELIRQRRARRRIEKQHVRVAEMYADARVVIEEIKGIFEGRENIGGVSCLHWDLVQVPRRTNTTE